MARCGLQRGTAIKSAVLRLAERSPNIRCPLPAAIPPASRRGRTARFGLRSILPTRSGASPPPAQSPNMRWPPKTPLGGPEEITTGPDGALWFTYPYARIGRITRPGKSRFIQRRRKPAIRRTSQPVRTARFGLREAMRANRAHHDRRRDQRVSAAQFQVPADGHHQRPDGALWFTEYKNSKIGRITTAGAITE